MTKNLVDAKKWALDVRNCLGKVETWLHHRNGDTEKVAFQDVEKLLSYNHLPCNEPGHLKLKVNFACKFHVKIPSLSIHAHFFYLHYAGLRTRCKCAAFRYNYHSFRMLTYFGNNSTRNVFV